MTLSDKPLKAFVSSTFIDLKDHRAHVINALRNAGLFVDPMENWTAEGDEPKKFSQDRLNGCDLCVLLVAFRRGFVLDGENRSITQMEYDTAVKQGIDILPFMLAEDAPWPRKFDELGKDPGIQTWRQQLQKSHGVESFSLDPRSIDMTGALGRWLAKRTPVQSEVGKIERIDWPEGKSPYRGLLWFNQEYAPLFFGRDRQVDELIGKLSEPGGRALLVIGASGSGKSSVVSAGVWQAVIKQGRLPGSAQWVWLRIQPSDGDTPSDALARGLKDIFQLSVRPRLTTRGSTLCDVLAHQLSQGQELILFVDQFEELFTSGFNEPDIQDFLELLIGTAKETIYRLRVVATIRSEFLGKLEAYESTLNLLNSPYRYHLGPVSPRMLQEMIEKPAEATGYTFEPGLVERILQDTGQAPGNVALVEYALKQLFERRKGRTFTVEAYEAIGGVVGAIATKANHVLTELPEEVRGAFDAVFAELVHVERERPPTRSRAAVSAFSADANALQLIEALAGQDCRILVTSGSGQEAIVEVTHEKLFTAWGKLKEWIDNSDANLRLIDFEEECAKRWHEKGCRVQNLWGSEQAAAVYSALRRFKKAPSSQLQTMMYPQDMLIERLDDVALSHLDRLLIGQKLTEFGDPRPGVGLTQDGLPDIEWVDIPGGEVKLDRVEDMVEVNPFRIATYPVTNEQFAAFENANDGYRNEEWWKDIHQHDKAKDPRWLDANCPRESVSWYEAIAFCRWLSHRTGSSIRLPTEWEWQQAATGGDSQRENPWPGEFDKSRFNSFESRLERTTAVGMYLAGATQHGVLDMAGNVQEWCLNTYERDITITTGGSRVLRGGSWKYLVGRLSTSTRYMELAGDRNNYTGFRLAQDIES
ncbi:MAG: SUMF1/EgtB/PvdO family nonheme iron enzyme [Nitrospira sp.]|nr:SUMF1/EgtB/PvdO family nonheme iron enzyme [Nitrospira sp.]